MVEEFLDVVVAALLVNNDGVATMLLGCSLGQIVAFKYMFGKGKNAPSLSAPSGSLGVP